MTTRLDDLLGQPAEQPDDTLVRDAPSVAQDPVEDDGDDLFADDEALRPKPRTSRLTLVLAALLILVIGFFVGVQAERAATGLLPRPAGSGGSSAAATPGG